MGYKNTALSSHKLAATAGGNDYDYFSHFTSSCVRDQCDGSCSRLWRTSKHGCYLRQRRRNLVENVSKVYENAECQRLMEKNNRRTKTSPDRTMIYHNNITPPLSLHPTAEGIVDGSFFLFLVFLRTFTSRNSQQDHPVHISVPSKASYRTLCSIVTCGKIFKGTTAPITFKSNIIGCK